MRSLRGIALRVLESATKWAFSSGLFCIYAIAVREQAGFFGSPFPKVSNWSGTNCSIPS